MPPSVGHWAGRGAAWAAAPVTGTAVHRLEAARPRPLKAGGEWGTRSPGVMFLRVRVRVKEAASRPARGSGGHGRAPWPRRLHKEKKKRVLYSRPSGAWLGALLLRRRFVPPAPGSGPTLV